MRALAISIYSAGLYLGMGLSLPLGGWIADRWNHAYAAGGAPLGLAGWQAAFLAVGLPGLLMALWMRSEEHTSELQSLMRISYAVFCLKKKKTSTSLAYRDKSSS